MPYNRSYSRRRPYRRTYRRRRYGSKTSRVAYKAYKMVKKVARSRELYWYNPIDETTTLGTIYTTRTDEVSNIGFMIPIAKVEQDGGATIVNTNCVDELGTKISPTSFHMNFSIGSSCKLRIVILAKLSGELAGPLDVYDLGESFSYLNMKSEDKQYETRVLFDKIYVYDTDTGDGYPEHKIYLKLSKKIPMIGYEAPSADATPDYTKNGLYMIMISNQDVLDAVDITYTFRTFFYND